MIERVLRGLHRAEDLLLAALLAALLLLSVAQIGLRNVEAAEVGPDHALFHVSSRHDEERSAGIAHAFTVRITSPLDNVFRVVVSHRKGRRERGPKLLVDASPRELSTSSDAAGWRLRAGALQLCVGRAPWSLRFADLRDQPITSSPAGALGLVDIAGHGAFMREQLGLAVGELLYGLGERFQPFVRKRDVKHNDDADITDLEAFRKQLNGEQKDVKVTMVALLLKAISSSLKRAVTTSKPQDMDASEQPLL